MRKIISVEVEVLGDKPLTRGMIDVIVRDVCSRRSDRRELRSFLLAAAGPECPPNIAKLFCGATTRTGSACKRAGTGQGGRCPNHGGKSTGPKTAEGLAAIASAQRLRWAAYRTARRGI